MTAPSPETGREWQALVRAYRQARRVRALAESWRWTPLLEVA